MSELPGRPMKYPYTWSAKLAQFPIKYYYQNNWTVRYYFFGIAAAAPVFWFISRLANSPGNVQKCEEDKRKKAAMEHH